MAKNDVNLPSMVEKKFEIYFSQMAKSDLNSNKIGREGGGGGFDLETL